MRTYKTSTGHVRTYRQRSGAVEFTVVSGRRVIATVTKSHADAVPLLASLSEVDNAQRA